MRGGGWWVWGSAPLWHSQLDQLAAISSFYLQKSQCHFGAVFLGPRTKLMLMRSLKSETAGLRAVIEHFELWSLARGAALFLLFLRYVQTAEPLVVECFSKCWTACVRRVMLGLICVCICVSVCAVRAGGPRIYRASTSCQWIVGQQQFSCPALQTEQLSSQKLFGSYKWVLWTSQPFFYIKSLC